MTINSKAKGKQGELELAHKLKEYGYDTKRSVQYNGKDGQADVVGLPHIHCEVKRVEKLNIYDAIDQAKRDAKNGDKPAVFHRKNRCNWLVTMELDRFLELYACLEKVAKLEKYIEEYKGKNG
jgi:Holliday junction resolvase